MAEPWPTTIRPTAMDVQLGTTSIIIESQRNPLLAFVWELPIQLWSATLTFGMLTEPQRRLLQGFLAGLDGPAGRVELPDWDYDGVNAGAIRGGATGSMTATGDKDAKIIDVSGVGGSAPHFRAGDRLGIGGYVYIVTADATASGGTAELSIRPRLRAQAAAAAVSVSGLTFVMRLADDAQNRIQARGGIRGEAAVSLVEAIDISA
jgi:hypothetical protein